MLADRDDGPVRLAELQRLLEAHRDAVPRWPRDSSTMPTSPAAVWVVEPIAPPAAPAAVSTREPAAATLAAIPIERPQPGVSAPFA